MNENQFNSTDYWRAIILYGLNTATYKIALAQCLLKFRQEDKTKVKMIELAEAFFDLYRERLVNNKPQLMLPNRLTVMERIIAQFNTGKINRETAIERVKQEAFGDVIPRFHTVNNTSIPTKFYDHTESGIVISDNLFEVFSVADSNLIDELDSRWDLLEAAFQLRREEGTLENDIRKIYLSKGYERTDITKTRPVLNGYQNGVCFYCGEKMDEEDVHVDHVIPRQLIYHDEIWNLVLSHSFCNQQKSDAIPGFSYINKLIERNEYFISSNHPIKHKIIELLGVTPEVRKRYVYQVYDDAKTVVKYTWEGIRGYNPATDVFYKNFIRRLTR